MTDHDFGFHTDFYTFAPETLQKQFPDFTILREVGKGSMGIVYEAVRKSDNQRVALKVLPPSLTLTDRALARFTQEGAVMSKIDNPAIVKVYEHGSHGRMHFFVMEFVDGMTLEERTKVGPLPIRTAAEIGVQVARALQYAHDHGVMHRDIKPGNLMIQKDGRVKITDFGLARETGTGSLTESGAIVGTPMYMAPEQIMGDRRMVDTRADVYGLGATLYELITGQPPFTGPTAQNVLRTVLEREPVPPGRLRSEIPRSLEAIILEALEKSPGRRYGSAQEMAEDLERFLRGERVAARRPVALERYARAAMKRPLISSLVAATLILLIASSMLWRDRQAAELRDKVAEAELAYSRATSLQPGARPPSLEERRQFLEKSRGLATEVIDVEPTLAAAWMVRGQVHHQLGELRQALVDMDQAERLGGLDKMQQKVLLEDRIHILQTLRPPRFQERVLQDVARLLKQDQGLHTRCLAIEQMILLAQDLTGNHRSQVVDQVKDMLGEIQEKNARTAVARAQLLELTGNKKQAVAAIEKACSDYAVNALVHRQAGKLYRRLGMIREAEAEESLARSMLGDPATAEPSEPQKPRSRPSVDLDRLAEFLNQVDRVLEAPKEGKDRGEEGKARTRPRLARDGNPDRGNGK